MPNTTKPTTTRYPIVRTVGFYAADDDRINLIRTRLAQSDPTRKLTLPDIIRFALRFTADAMPK
jgi:hypothetical protein